MTEANSKVSIRAMGVLHTFRASTIATKYHIDVKDVKKMKFGGVVSLDKSKADKLVADGLAKTVKKKSQEK